MMGRSPYNYIFIDWYVEYGEAYWSVWIEFKIKDESSFNRLIHKLKRDHNYSYEEEMRRHVFIKYYGFASADDAEYKIYLNEDGSGWVSCEGYLVVESRDDYTSALMERDHCRYTVLKRFA